MEYKTINLFEDNNIAIIEINRPDKLNALNFQIINELEFAIEYLINSKAIRCIVFTGKGQKSFVAGADISEICNLDEENAFSYSQKGSSLFKKISESPKPTIAAINGYALGGGCELALACNLRIASNNSQLGLPEINLGLIPGFGGTQRLSKTIGLCKATELLLLGEPITAEDALQIGLINRITTQEELMNEVLLIAQKIASKPLTSVKYIMELLKESQNNNTEIGLKLESQLFSKLVGTNDFKEGTSAFLEKRNPIFNTGKIFERD